MNVSVCLLIILSEVIMNFHIVLKTPKTPYLNQATQKNTCQIFLPQNILESKISNPKNPSIILDTWESGVPPWGFIYVWYDLHGILLNTIIVRLSHQAR